MPKQVKPSQARLGFSAQPARPPAVCATKSQPQHLTVESLSPRTKSVPHQRIQALNRALNQLISPRFPTRTQVSSTSAESDIHADRQGIWASTQRVWLGLV